MPNKLQSEWDEATPIQAEWDAAESNQIPRTVPQRVRETMTQSGALDWMKQNGPKVPVKDILSIGGMTAGAALGPLGAGLGYAGGRQLGKVY